MKKKVIILSMSCRDDFFQKQIEDIKSTYVANLPENMRFIYYDGYWKHTKLIDDYLMCHTCDDLESTFLKTYTALQHLYHNVEFDYIFRTNTSTYVNTKLLNEYIHHGGLSEDVVYGSDLYSLSEACCPSPLYLYARGNGILLSRKLVEIILVEGIPFLNTKIVDDVVIGNILNSFRIKQRDEYLKYIKGLPHGWYKSVDNAYDNGHKLCRYNDDKADYSDFVTIQVKSYVDRNSESSKYHELHQLINDGKLNYRYLNNPSVFIGSAIGYIDYDVWKNMDKRLLFEYEISHKGQNDPESLRVYNTRWDDN